jgi:prepilin-type N-terminal cleavage/methylation domain-containing protein
MIIPMSRQIRGFTLIELMITATILGILSMIAIPKFAGLILKSKEAAVKGNLGAVRGAFRICIADNSIDEFLPSPDFWIDDVGDSLAPKYIDQIPLIRTPQHGGRGRNGFIGGGCSELHYNIGNGYCDNNNLAPGWVWDQQPRICCTHSNSIGEIWSSL